MSILIKIKDLIGMKLKLVDKKLSDYNIHWVIIGIKFILIAIGLICNLVVRKCLCPLVCYLSSRFHFGMSGDTCNLLLILPL
jgi:hypothetical protein